METKWTDLEIKHSIFLDLVLWPEFVLKQIMDFIGEPWDNSLLNHHLHLDRVGLASTEKSTKQVRNIKIFF